MASRLLSDVRGCSVSPASMFGMSVDSMGLGVVVWLVDVVVVGT